MARISGVDIPREKRLEVSLTYIYGIGRTTAQQICQATSIECLGVPPTSHSPIEPVRKRDAFQCQGVLKYGVIVQDEIVHYLTRRRFPCALQDVDG